jgi:MFS family permease
VLASRQFGPYFVGNAASASGTWFQNLAASILIFRLTHSAFMLGVLNFCQFVPVLLLVPWAGAAADRFDRRKLLICTQLGAGAVSAGLAALAWDGLARVWVVIAVSVMLGILGAFSSPSQTSMVGSLVEREDLAQAVALNSMTFNLARAVGPASAAGVIAAFGIAPAFAVNACSFLLLAGALMIVRPREQRRARRTSLKDSFRLIRESPTLGWYLLITATVSFSSDPINTESPAFAHAFHHSAAWSGAVVGSFGAGAVAAALLVAGRVSGSRARMAMTLVLLGVGIMLFAVSPWLPLALGFALVAGFGYLSSNTSATSRLQLGVAEHERGRIMALWSVAFFGIRPLASLLDGGLAASFGVRVAAIAMSVPALVGAVLAATAFHRRRRYVPA